MDDRKILQQALDALEWASDLNQIAQSHNPLSTVIDKLRAALAAQPAEPVARVVPFGATVNLEWASVAAAHNCKPGPLYAAPPAPAAVPDMRHPKIQALISIGARCRIEQQLVEQLLEDPNFETTAMDMEYWGPLHDKLKAALTAPPAPAAVPPGYVLVPREPTPEMVDAYLKANAAYWVRIDQGPPKIGVWRNGTPKEATAEALRAALAQPADCGNTPYDEGPFTLAQPAEPLDSTHAELWRLAVRKGIVTVHSELIDDRNPNTRCSWMQGNDKACDISNDAAKVAGDKP